MAKVNGPLMSLSASGGFASSLVFGSWKGRPTVHQLVTPSNPRSADQTTERNIMRATGAMQRWANATTTKLSGQTETDKARLITAAPSGYAWNGNLAKAIVGAGNITYTAGRAAYAALTGGQRTAWTSAAAALTPAIPDVEQKVAVTNATGTALSKGEVFYLYQTGMHSLGLNPTPSGTPPTYA